MFEEVPRTAAFDRRDIDILASRLDLPLDMNSEDVLAYLDQDVSRYRRLVVEDMQRILRDKGILGPATWGECLEAVIKVHRNSVGKNIPHKGFTPDMGDIPPMYNYDGSCFLVAAIRMMRSLPLEGDGILERAIVRGDTDFLRPYLGIFGERSFVFVVFALLRLVRKFRSLFSHRVVAEELEKDFSDVMIKKSKGLDVHQAHETHCMEEIPEDGPLFIGVESPSAICFLDMTREGFGDVPMEMDGYNLRAAALREPNHVYCLVREEKGWFLHNCRKDGLKKEVDPERFLDGSHEPVCLIYTHEDI